MACLIKAPVAGGLGCVSFTTPERDQAINKDPRVRAEIEALKNRFLVGLHHNWHDHAFVYDPLFDFSMAGDGDLIERNGKPFVRIPLDACNFAPACFIPRRLGVEPFWDVLNASRAVFFKGIPEFFQAIRTIYDRGRFIRVLQLCPVPPPSKGGTDLSDVRQRYEAIFSPEERRFFTLLTMEWDYPFPLDLDTLAFFYRASRVYVQPAPQEVRCRVAAYAWATGVPVVGRENVASIVPPGLRRRPFWFAFDAPGQMADAILDAIDHGTDDRQWDAVSDEFRSERSAQRMNERLAEMAATRGAGSSEQPINPNRLDIRLGRHHLPPTGPNNIPQSLTAFCTKLRLMSDADLADFAAQDDPELALARGDPCVPVAIEVANPDRGASNLVRRFFGK
jgi:glycosyltransferase involved in cell wall biosynthesis